MNSRVPSMPHRSFSGPPSSLARPKTIILKYYKHKQSVNFGVFIFLARKLTCCLDLNIFIYLSRIFSNKTHFNFTIVSAKWRNQLTWLLNYFCLSTRAEYCLVWCPCEPRGDGGCRQARPGPGVWKIYWYNWKIFTQIRAAHLGYDHPALGLRQHELGLGQRGEEVAALKIDTYLDIT